MAVNKVEINGEVQLDLTQDTVTPQTLLSGATAHSADGNAISGAAPAVRYDTAQSLSTTQKKQARDNIGAGDMLASVYDSGGKKQNIYAYADNVSAYEAKLQWGGAEISNGISPIDAAALPNLYTNRLAFAKANFISVEYSNDGGTTWQDYGLSDEEKIAIITDVAEINEIYVGKNPRDATIDSRLRLTIDAVSSSIYTRAKKILVNFNTTNMGKHRMTVETATIGSPDTFTQLGQYDISGGPGWNSIPCDFILGGNPTQYNQAKLIRFTFQPLANPSSSYISPFLRRVFVFGINDWYTPSNLARFGRVYTYDAAQNVTFPGKVSATEFSGKGGDVTVDFSQNTTRANISTGEKISVLFGKISKWFADLKGLAFKDKVALSDLEQDVRAGLAPEPSITYDDDGKFLRVEGDKWVKQQSIIYSTEDLTAGTSQLGSGVLYVVYE